MSHYHHHHKTAGLIFSTAAAAVVTAFYYNHPATTTNDDDSSSQQQYYFRQQKQQEEKYRIPIDFVDRLAHKPYLTTLTKKHNNNTNSIPPGVPHQLRILAIDVPQMQDDAFRGGRCRVSAHDIFPPHVAPPKQIIIPSLDNNTSNSSTTSIPQKALVHSMIQCMTTTSDNDDDDDDVDQSPPKVLIMQASIADLNPNNVRKTRQFGNLYRYDPGKYTSKKQQQQQQQQNQQQQVDNEETTDAKEEEEFGAKNKQQEQQEQQQPNMEAIEIDAPWNQYAWMEELHLRIAGRVFFGAPMESSSFMNRILYGNVYKSTIPSARNRFWDWCLFFVPFSSSSSPTITTTTTAEGIRQSNRRHATTTTTTAYGGGATGMDANNSNNNWASNKPHAVIANGAALQRVPTSLAIVQRYCQQSQVPLYVIDDPRILWGGNTHDSFPDAIRDMKRQIKQNIIVHAMEQQSGFQRGRLYGNVEAETRHYWHNAQNEKKRNQQLLREKRWGQLNSEQLHKKFLEYGLMTPNNTNDSDDEDKKSTQNQYSQGLKDLIRQCMADMEEEEYLDKGLAEASEAEPT